MISNSAKVQKNTNVDESSYDFISSVDKRCNLSYQEYFTNYMSKNLPVIITDLTDDWNSRRDWVCKDMNGKLR